MSRNLMQNVYYYSVVLVNDIHDHLYYCTIIYLMQNHSLLHSDCTDERGIDDDDHDDDDDEEEEEDDDEDYSVLAPTPKHSKLASLIALDTSLKSGLYPEFKGVYRRTIR